MRKSAIGDFIDLLSSFVRNEQKARRKFCASYNAYWQWVKKICFIIFFLYLPRLKVPIYRYIFITYLQCVAFFYHL